MTREELLSALGGMGDSQRRLAWLVERARRRPALPAADRIDAHRIEGCQARVWLKAERRDGLWSFAVDSDAATLKALGGLLGELASGLPDAAPRLDMAALERLGLWRHLAPSRAATVLRIAQAVEACGRDGTPSAACPGGAPGAR